MFELSEEHREFRHSVRDFAEAEIAPHAAEWDRKHYFPVEVVQKMGKLGLFGLTAPEEYGGAGGDFTSLCVAIEEISRVDQSMGITLEAAVGLGINPILTFGTDEQKATWLPDLVAGQKLAGFGLTEPESGSDAGATKTRAVLDGGEWVIDGSKQFITNSGSSITSCVTVTARTGEKADGKAGDLHDHRPEPVRRASSPRRRTTSSAGTRRDTHPLSFDRLPGARGEPARRARQGVRAVPRHARRRAGRDRGGRARAASGRAWRCRSSTPVSGRRSVVRSGASRASRSRSRT